MPAKASGAGTFSLGGDVSVNRLGYGAMRITRPGIMGEPRDVGEARRVLLRAIELGVTFIDTAHAYGPLDREGEHGVDELAERASFCACAEAIAPRHLPGLIVLHVAHDRV